MQGEQSARKRMRILGRDLAESLAAVGCLTVRLNYLSCYLKQANDTLGHDTEIFCCSAWRKRFWRAFRAMRVGGEEFLILGMRVSKQEAGERI